MFKHTCMFIKVCKTKIVGFFQCVLLTAHLAKVKEHVTNIDVPMVITTLPVTKLAWVCNNLIFVF